MYFILRKQIAESQGVERYGIDIRNDEYKRYVDIYWIFEKTNWDLSLAEGRYDI